MEFRNFNSPLIVKKRPRFEEVEITAPEKPSVYVRLSNKDFQNCFSSCWSELQSILPAYAHSQSPAEEGLKLVIRQTLCRAREQTVFVRNLSHTEFSRKEGADVLKEYVGLRLPRGSSALLEGHSLLFKGHLYGQVLEIESIEVTDAGDRKPFESEIRVPFFMLGAQEMRKELHQPGLLHEELKKLTSYCESIDTELTPWRRYLDWSEQLTKMQLYGFKYVSRSYNAKSHRLSFTLLMEGVPPALKEGMALSDIKDKRTYFEKHRYIFRNEDFCIFDNRYSQSQLLYRIKHRVAGRLVMPVLHSGEVCAEGEPRRFSDEKDGSLFVDMPEADEMTGKETLVRHALTKAFLLEQGYRDPMIAVVEFKMPEQLVKALKKLWYKESLAFGGKKGGKKPGAQNAQSTQHSQNAQNAVSGSQDADDEADDALFSEAEKGLSDAEFFEAAPTAFIAGALENENLSYGSGKRKVSVYIPHDGFLALSGVGHFALQDRLRRALDDFSKCTYKFLSYKNSGIMHWLFDITNAQLPEEPVSIPDDEWGNKSIRKNQFQKEAVEKLLAVPKVGLLQGPPGTGKTTVIAEIIYQLARKGKTVLLASQSNDAVDNALDKLPKSPQVRAIRFGPRGRWNLTDAEKESGEFDKFAVSLRWFYESFGGELQSQLARWDGQKKQAAALEEDETNAALLADDVTRLKASVSGWESDIQRLTVQINEDEKRIAEAESAGRRRESEKAALAEFELFVRHAGENAGALSRIRFSDEQLKAVQQLLEEETDALSQGAVLSTASMPRELLSQVHFLLEAYSAMQTALGKQTGSLQQGAGASDERSALQAELELVIKDMAAAGMRADIEAITRLNSRKTQLESKLSAFGSTALIPVSYKSRFEPAFLTALQGEAATEALTKLSSCAAALEKLFSEMQASLAALLARADAVDVESLKERVKKENAAGKLSAAKDALSAAQKKLKEKMNAFFSIARAHGLGSEENAFETFDALSAAVMERLQEEKRRLEAASDPLAEKTWRSVYEALLSKCARPLLMNDDGKCSDPLYQDYASQYNVIGITCTDNMQALSSRLGELPQYHYSHFDVAIIDEVSKATPPELLVPMLMADKVILVGDHRQLPPLFKEHEKSYTEMVNEIPEDADDDLKSILTPEKFAPFKELVTASLFKQYFEQADERIKHSLRIQYRMHTDIMDIVNYFYNNEREKLLSGWVDETSADDTELQQKRKRHGIVIQALKGERFIEPKKHAYWIDSSYYPVTDENGRRYPAYEGFKEHSTSAANVLEVRIVVELLKKIAAFYAKPELSRKLVRHEDGTITDTRVTVGIISFYMAQIRLLRDEIRELKKQVPAFASLNIDVNTVDRFQGKESNIIIASLVRNNPTSHASKHVVAFERVNVAFSRAQNALFIVGAKHMYEKLNIDLPNPEPGAKEPVTEPVYDYIIADLQRKGACFDCSKLLDKNLVKDLIYEKTTAV